MSKKPDYEIKCEIVELLKNYPNLTQTQIERYTSLGSVKIKRVINEMIEEKELKKTEAEGKTFYKLHAK